MLRDESIKLRRGLCMEPLARERLARNIRRLRLAKHLRQIDLAQASHVSRSAISAMERGQIGEPSTLLITAVARALGVSYDDLVGLSDTETSIVELLEHARRTVQSPQWTLLKVQRALIRSRQRHLCDAERESAQFMAKLYQKNGDPYRASLYAGWGASGLHPSLKNQEALLLWGEQLQDLGESLGTIALYRHFLLGTHRANPVFAKSFMALGRAYMQAHLYPQAVRKFLRAHQDSLATGDAMTSGWALVGLSHALGFVGRHTEATQANVSAGRLAHTYHWNMLGHAVDRTEELLLLLNSDSLGSARLQWQAAMHIIGQQLEPFSDQMNLLHSWIYVASHYEAWVDVIAAAESGLQLVSNQSYGSNRSNKGHFLWARAEGNQKSGNPWEHDREWAADLLRIELRRPLDKVH